MLNQFLAFALCAGSILAAAWTVIYGRPIVARARFRAELSRLRDRTEDYVFVGDLPDEEPVQFFWSKLSVILEHPEFVSLSQAVANELVPSGLPESTAPKSSDLAHGPRERLEELEQEFIVAMADYICNGSRLWPVVSVLRHIPVPDRQAAPAARPEQLALDWNATLDRARGRDANGLPQLSTGLLAAAAS